MQKTSETEQILSRILIEFDEKRPRSLYASLQAAAKRLGIENGEIPETGYAAAAAFVRNELLKLTRDGVKLVDSVFDAIDELEGVEELKEKAKNAKMPYMFFAAMTKMTIEDIDADYLAETMIEAGKARDEKRRAERAAKKAAT